MSPEVMMDKSKAMCGVFLGFEYYLIVGFSLTKQM